MNLREAVEFVTNSVLSENRRVSARQVARRLGEDEARVREVMDSLARRGLIRAVDAKPRRPNSGPSRYYENGRG